MTATQAMFWFPPQAGKACLIAPKARPWDINLAKVAAVDRVCCFPGDLHHRKLICEANPDGLVPAWHQ